MNAGPAPSCPCTAGAGDARRNRSAQRKTSNARYRTRAPISGAGPAVLLSPDRDLCGQRHRHSAHHRGIAPHRGLEPGDVADPVHSLRPVRRSRAGRALLHRRLRAGGSGGGAQSVGMGMPTAALYILVAVLVTPPLVNVGVDPLAAHLFVLYFGLMSTITPPVALAAYAASNIGAPGRVEHAGVADRLHPSGISPLLRHRRGAGADNTPACRSGLRDAHRVSSRRDAVRYRPARPIRPAGPCA